jgi:D-3-phosphoglycerate dehydrogenase
MSYEIVVSDIKVLDRETMERLFGSMDATLTVTEASKPQEVIDVAAGADALIIDSRVQVTDAVIDALDSLRVVGRAGIGIDNIDVEAAINRGVTVVNVPDYSVEEVSTHALALMLACLRRIPTFDRAVKDGGWDWEVGKPIPRLAGQTIGLVSFGKISRRFAAKLRGFDVDVLAYDPYVREYRMRDFGVSKVGFDELLEGSDIVSVHAPLTEETRGLFDEQAFATMRDDAVFINTARGPIVDEAALHDTLRSGDIGGAGLDVRETEPPNASPLHDLDTVVLSPHTAWYSETSREILTETVCEDVRRVLQGREPKNPVDPETGWF